MTYSCAIFTPDGGSLAAAQRRKLERVCTKLELTPGDRVLEIGSGWGSFALHAAASRGCRVTTATVSAPQYEATRRRVHQAGLDDRVEVLQAGWRQLGGRYDKLVSIEMIEAVDWRRHIAFFDTCGQLLAPKGRMLLQAIVIADSSFERAKLHDDFIRRLIFPGSCTPSVSSLCRSLARVGRLRLLGLEDIGRHYPPTLARWRANLEARWPEMAALGLSDRFHRLWQLYLSYCDAAFLERHISDVQMLLAGPDYRPPLAIRTV